MENVTDLVSFDWNTSLVTAATISASSGDGSIDIVIKQKLLQTIYVLIGAVGIIGNLLVAIVFIKYKLTKRNITNVFILNQSVTDLLTALSLLLTTVTGKEKTNLSGLADEIYCLVWLGKMPIWIFILTSTYNLVFLTVERYLEIVHPIWHHVHFGRKLTAGSICCAWIIGSVFNIAYDVATSRVVNGQCILLSFWPNKAVQTAAGVIAFILQYFIPLFVFVVCYSAMIITLHKKMASVAPGYSVNEFHVNRENRMIKARRVITKTLTFVSLGFIVCYSCNQWFFLLFNVGFLNYSHFQTNFYHISVIAMFANCSVNPVIYALNYTEFRKGLCSLFKSWRRNFSGPRTIDTVT